MGWGGGGGVGAGEVGIVQDDDVLATAQATGNWFVPSTSKPTVALAPGARDAFQPAGVTLTEAPDTVLVPFQRLPSVPPDGSVKPSDQVGTVVVPLLVMVNVAV